MDRFNPGEKGEPEPLSSFIEFETRAREVGIAGLDEAIEQSTYPENMLTIEDLGMVTLVVAIPYAKLLCAEEYNGLGAGAAYNGYYFAAVVSNYLIGNVGRPMPPPYPSAFQEIYYDPEGKQKALAKQAAYLKDRPMLKAWIDRYLPMINPHGRYSEVAATVAALTMKDIEERERQGFIDAEVYFHVDNFHPPEV